ncbi:NUDIX hydrolase [Haladaptatus pallidirubidus]|uniref:NUDIX hydrolase n=1 Tax=Haladaptatus pallidirubidus TaxID=1008152 RepID=A0AAV3UE90_9EURY|nr:NUDIX hydrolase [Haladaptatus pallidirubidus]
MADEDDPLAWETLESDVAYACPGFDIRHEDVRLPDGTKTDFDYLSESESVVVLPFTEDGDVVVIEEWRQAVSRVSRGLPVGGVEPEDDDLEASARRELTEETGYEAARVSHLTTVEPANGIADSVLHYFVAHGCVPTGKQELDHNESIRPTTTTFDALKEEIETDGVYDGRTALGVLYYEAFGN